MLLSINTLFQWAYLCHSLSLSGKTYIVGKLICRTFSWCENFFCILNRFWVIIFRVVFLSCFGYHLWIRNGKSYIVWKLRFWIFVNVRYLKVIDVFVKMILYVHNQNFAIKTLISKYNLNKIKQIHCSKINVTLRSLYHHQWIHFFVKTFMQNN